MDFKLTEFRCKHCGGGIGVVSLTLLNRLQSLRDLWGQPMHVTSGYRCREHNRAIGGALRSLHMEGLAADIADKDGALKRFCTPEVLTMAGLYMEHPDHTRGWAHFQIKPPKSGERIFKP